MILQVQTSEERQGDVLYIYYTSLFKMI